MSLRNATPVHFSPSGLSDNLDGTNLPPGLCSALINLIPDPTTKNLWQCRPASLVTTSFASFTTPGFISAELIVGTKVFGMIASGRNVGKDEPFVYDLLTGAFSTVTGITNANTPTSPATSGDWVPPTMDVVGTKVIVTHPGFNGGGGVFFGWFEITDPANITWNGGNTTTNGLPAVPTAVKQFTDRAYFIVNPATGQPGVYYTDTLTLTITSGTQVLTFGDNVKLTALGALPLSNQLGGIIQSLIVFKGAAVMYQVTGNPALTANPLTVNTMNVATGTLAPLSICPTPRGLAFIAPDGLRVISFQGVISDPIGDAGTGVTTPFIYAIAPSRIAAACNANTYRVSVQNGAAIGTPNQEFWYNIPRGAWSGPHNFPASQIKVYNGTFIMAPIGVTAKLFQSDAAQTLTSTFVENGVQMTFTIGTTMLPDTRQMSENAIVESTWNMSYAAGGVYNAYCGDQDGALFDSILLTAPASTTVWGGFTWGAALWQGAANALGPRPLDWTIPIVFRRLYMGITGNCASGVKIGDLFMRYQQLGYLQQVS